MDSPKHKVLLTGATGTLGRNFLALASELPDMDVLALCRQESNTAMLPASFHYEHLDLSDLEVLRARIIEYHPTCILHCAATGMSFPRASWFDLIRFNVDWSIALCECASLVPECHFIHVSTGLAYKEQGRPLRETDPLDTLHPYGASKAAADLLVRSAAAEFRVPTTIIRPFSFTGMGDDRTRLFSTLLRSAASGAPMQLSDCAQVRDHCSAQDIAAGIMACIRGFTRHSDLEIFNLGSGSALPLRALIETIVSELRIPIKLEFGAKPRHPFEPAHLVADISKAEAHLGWTPRHSLAHAVWSLADESFPSLGLPEPTAAFHRL